MQAQGNEGKRVIKFPPINLLNYRYALTMGLWLAMAPIAQLYRPDPSRRTGCWSDGPRPHPWHIEITDMACGYDHKMTDTGCSGCWRQRNESPIDQIPDARGYVKHGQETAP